MTKEFFKDLSDASTPIWRLVIVKKLRSKESKEVIV